MVEVSSAAAFGGHLSLNPSRYKPPYTRPVSRSFGSGVRSERCCTDASTGALRQFIWRSRLLDNELLLILNLNSNSTYEPLFSNLTSLSEGIYFTFSTFLWKKPILYKKLISKDFFLINL